MYVLGDSPVTIAATIAAVSKFQSKLGVVATGTYNCATHMAYRAYISVKAGSSFWAQATARVAERLFDSAGPNPAGLSTYMSSLGSTQEQALVYQAYLAWKAAGGSCNNSGTPADPAIPATPVDVASFLSRYGWLLAVAAVLGIYWVRRSKQLQGLGHVRSFPQVQYVGKRTWTPPQESGAPLRWKFAHTDGTPGLLIAPSYSHARKMLREQYPTADSATLRRD